MVTRKCQWCGEEKAEVLDYEGNHLTPHAIVCELCDLMPEMLHAMEEPERMAHQKEVARKLMVRKMGK